MRVKESTQGVVTYITRQRIKDGPHRSEIPGCLPTGGPLKEEPQLRKVDTQGNRGTHIKTEE